MLSCWWLLVYINVDKLSCSVSRVFIWSCNVSLEQNQVVTSPTLREDRPDNRLDTTSPNLQAWDFQTSLWIFPLRKFSMILKLSSLKCEHDELAISVPSVADAVKGGQIWLFVNPKDLYQQKFHCQTRRKVQICLPLIVKIHCRYLQSNGRYSTNRRQDRKTFAINFTEKKNHKRAYVPYMHIYILLPTKINA